MITNITAIRPNGTLQHFGVCIQLPHIDQCAEDEARQWLATNFPDFTLFETTVRYRAS